jgi:GT2 family glycosyltransferase
MECRDNVGFPAACNEMLMRCTSNVVALVNPDIELTSGALAHLVEVVTADESVAIAGCRQMTRDGCPQPEAARSRPRLRRLLLSSLPHGLFTPLRKWRRRDDGPLYAVRDVECMSGALMVFRRDVLSEIGYFDDSVFMYLEDIDFAARVKKAGKRIRYIGTTWVWHESGTSAQPHKRRLYRLMPEVWITYICRYGNWLERLAVRPVLVVVATVDALRRLGARRTPRDELAAVSQAIRFVPSQMPTWSAAAGDNVSQDAVEADPATEADLHHVATR